MTTGVGFAVGTGRCGTHFLHHLLAEERDVSSHHERHPLSDAFQRYCQWYGLGVDPAGFLEEKRRGIEADHQDRPFSFEASAYLSLSVRLLYQQFNARFVFLVRHPHDVIISLHKKGWYEQPIYRDSASLAPTIQPGQQRHHHSFSRIVPYHEPCASRWRQYTRIGKLAWYWRQLNEAVFAELDAIPQSHSLLVRLEDLDHAKYRQIARFLGIDSSLGKRQFHKIRKTKTSSLQPSYSIAQWPRESAAEYRQEVYEMARRLDYSI